MLTSLLKSMKGYAFVKIKWLFPYITILFVCSCAHLDKKFFEAEVNDAYYNLDKEGVESFKCTIIEYDSLGLNKKINDVLPPENFIPINISYSAVVNRDTDVEISIKSHFKTDIQRLKSIVTRQMESSSAMLENFLSSWKELHFDQILSDSEKPYTALSHPNGYVLMLSDDSYQIRMALSNEYEISEMKIINEDEVTMLPQFIKSPKGYLLISYRITMDKEDFNAQHVIEYDENGEHYLPKSLEIESVIQGKHLKKKFLFTNYVFNYEP